MCVCMCVCVCVCVSACVHMYTYMCVCVCVWYATNSAISSFYGNLSSWGHGHPDIVTAYQVTSWA